MIFAVSRPFPYLVFLVFRFWADIPEILQLQCSTPGVDAGSVCQFVSFQHSLVLFIPFISFLLLHSSSFRMSYRSYCYFFLLSRVKFWCSHAINFRCNRMQKYIRAKTHNARKDFLGISSLRSGIPIPPCAFSNPDV